MTKAEADLESFGPIVEDEDETKKLDLAAEVARLRLVVAQYQKLVERDQVHQKHYEMARKYVKTRETNLKPNEVLLFRDFVSQYNEKGTKVSALVFVIILASLNGVGLAIDYVDNFATAKCDSYFHAVALDFLLQRNDIFKKGTHLII